VKLTREARVRWLCEMGLPVPPELEREPVPVVADVAECSLDRERPRCARCGGQPHLGRWDGETMRSLCRGCAEAEILEKLTLEERSLLRS
jgi:hypothetical protein